MTVRLSTKLRDNLAGSTGFGSTFANGYIEIYSGSQPATADAAVTGTLLGIVTLNGGAFTPGSGTNGLTFAAAAAGAISKSGVWQFTGLSPGGTAGWFRLKTNAETAGGGISTVLARLDGSIAVSGGDMNLSNITIATSSSNTIDSFTFTVPAA